MSSISNHMDELIKMIAIEKLCSILNSKGENSFNNILPNNILHNSSNTIDEIKRELQTIQDNQNELKLTIDKIKETKCDNETIKNKFEQFITDNAIINNEIYDKFDLIKEQQQTLTSKYDSLIEEIHKDIKINQGNEILLRNRFELLISNIETFFSNKSSIIDDLTSKFNGIENINETIVSNINKINENIQNHVSIQTFEECSSKNDDNLNCLNISMQNLKTEFNDISKNYGNLNETISEYVFSKCNQTFISRTDLTNEFINKEQLATFLFNVNGLVESMKQDIINALYKNENNPIILLGDKLKMIENKQKEIENFQIERINVIEQKYELLENMIRNHNFTITNSIEKLKEENSDKVTSHDEQLDVQSSDEHIEEKSDEAKSHEEKTDEQLEENLHNEQLEEKTDEQLEENLHDEQLEEENNSEETHSETEVGTDDDIGTDTEELKNDADDDESVFEIEIDDVSYYATDEDNGILYEKLSDGEIGKKVGIITNGEPIFN
jgi:hypothetical protein